MEKQIEIDQEILSEKRGNRLSLKLRIYRNFNFLGELKILHSSVFFEPSTSNITLLSRNQSVNQIIGLQKKETMIQELIDTSKEDLSFQQLLPTLKESIEVIPKHIPTASLNDKFNKICFIPPCSTSFTMGKQLKPIAKVNKLCVQLALKKSICGLARVSDYTEISESALTMFTDAVDHYFKSLMESIVTVLTNDDRETE